MKCFISIFVRSALFSSHKRLRLFFHFFTCTHRMWTLEDPNHHLTNAWIQFFFLTQRKCKVKNDVQWHTSFPVFLSRSFSFFVNSIIQCLKAITCSCTFWVHWKNDLTLLLNLHTHRPDIQHTTNRHHRKHNKILV